LPSAVSMEIWFALFLYLRGLGMIHKARDSEARNKLLELSERLTRVKLRNNAC
jgi:hypothetical protein